jgi:hypothetical protein
VSAPPRPTVRRLGKHMLVDGILGRGVAKAAAHSESTCIFEAHMVRRELAVLQQLSLDLQDRAVDVVLDLVDPFALPLNVRDVNVGTRPSE